MLLSSNLYKSRALFRKIVFNANQVVSMEESATKVLSFDITESPSELKPEVDTTKNPMTYFEALVHLFKANVGTGCLAMAEAVKNGGLLLAPVLTLLLGIICVQSQHILVNCSEKMKQKHHLRTSPDYAETVELSFLSSNHEKVRKLAPAMKQTCNIFICITQLGFCCIYLLFVGTNLKQVLDFYGFQLNIHVIVAISLIPIWLTALITKLKFLGEFWALDCLL